MIETLEITLLILSISWLLMANNLMRQIDGRGRKIFPKKDELYYLNQTLKEKRKELKKVREMERISSEIEETDLMIKNPPNEEFEMFLSEQESLKPHVPSKIELKRFEEEQERKKKRFEKQKHEENQFTVNPLIILQKEHANENVRVFRHEFHEDDVFDSNGNQILSEWVPVRWPYQVGDLVDVISKDNTRRLYSFTLTENHLKLINAFHPGVKNGSRIKIKNKKKRTPKDYGVLYYEEHGHRYYYNGRHTWCEIIERR